MMKKIIFLTIFLGFCLSGMCQQIVIKDSVTFVLPKSTEKLTMDSAKRFINKKFNNNKFADIINAQDHYIGKSADIILVFYYRSTGEDLSKRKKESDGFNRRYNNIYYSSELKKINDNQVFIYNNTTDKTIGIYHFYCCNSANNRELIGVLEFSPSDKDNSKVILDNLLNSIKFK